VPEGRGGRPPAEELAKPKAWIREDLGGFELTTPSHFVSHPSTGGELLPQTILK